LQNNFFVKAFKATEIFDSKKSGEFLQNNFFEKVKNCLSPSASILNLLGDKLSKLGDSLVEVCSDTLCDIFLLPSAKACKTTYIAGSHISIKAVQPF
jgi:hypothetical protein